MTTSEKVVQDNSTKMNELELQSRLNKLERTTVNANGRHVSTERIIFAICGTACIALLAIIGFLGVQILSHVSDGTKHENGEQKLLRIENVVAKGLKGVETRLNRIDHSLSEVGADVRVLKERTANK